jgi:enoyl-CoA hydratase/carnithine racemase
MNETILFETNGGVATVTLNRPDKLNAWTWRMEDEFVAALRNASADSSIRVIVITGAGRAFCAGADMNMLEGIAHESGKEGGHRTVEVDFPLAPPELRRRYSWMHSIPQPVIAALNGPAVGLGAVLPLYCDFRLAAQSLKFSTIFAKRGLIAEFGMAWLLPRLTGTAAAMDMLLTGRMVGAEEALRLGLVHRVYPDETFAAEVRAFAQDLANSVSPRSLRVIKQQVYAGQTETLAAAIDRSFREMQTSLECDDFKEGVAHFLEKRPPRFTGR